MTTKRPYCGDCRYSHYLGGDGYWIPLSNFSCSKGHNTESFYNESCEDYKRKWWKFWVKRIPRPIYITKFKKRLKQGEKIVRNNPPHKNRGK